MVNKKIWFGILVITLVLGMITIGCDSANSFKKKGDSFFAAGDFEQAVEFYGKAIEKKPSSNLYKIRSEAYLKQKNTAAALDDLNTAITLNPILVEAYSTRASIYLDLEDYVSARVDYNKILDIDPENQEGKKKISEIDEIEDMLATNALKNTTWFTFPVIKGVSMRNYNNGYLSMTLRFDGKEPKYKIVTELGGYYTGPSAYGLVNGQRLPFDSSTTEGTFAVKKNKLILNDGSYVVEGEIAGNIIRFEEEGSVMEYKKQ